MPISVEFIRKLEQVSPDLKEILIALLEEIERQREESITVSEFRAFTAKTEENFKKVWQAISELAKAQKDTEKRMEELAIAQKNTEKRVEELTVAQKNTEKRVEELFKNQIKSEERLSRVEKAIEDLTEAQKNTEKRIEKLSINQIKSEERLSRVEKVIEELAIAQKNTENELKKLIKEHRKTRESLGGLQHTVGYVLEDRAFVGLPKLLEKDFGIKITMPLKRDYMEISPGKEEEINIIGRGKRDGREIWILGECKSQINKREVDKFLRKVNKLNKVIPGEKILLIITYQAPPIVRRYIEEKGLKLYFSYQFPL